MHTLRNRNMFAMNAVETAKITVSRMPGRSAALEKQRKGHSSKEDGTPPAKTYVGRKEALPREIMTDTYMHKRGKARPSCNLHGALRRALLWMLLIFLCASSANADCSHVADEVARILPESTVQCEGGRCNLLIEDAGLAKTKDVDKALQYLRECERRRLNTITPLTDSNIHEAVSAWLQDETSARQTYGDISVWDTSEVTDMSDLFCAHADCGDKKKSAAASFNGNLSAWNVGKVSTMFRMFYFAVKFNSDVSKWDVGKVSTMHKMFDPAYKFNSDVSKWDVSKVSTMYATFLHAEKFNSDLSKWDVAKWDVARVTSMYKMFQNAYKFNSDVSKWKVAQVNNFGSMFFEARRFNFKSVLESSLRWENNANFPGGSMFNGTCSEDRENGGSCGTCTDASFASGNQPVECGAMRERKVGGLDCTFCTDYGDECCLPFVAADSNIHEAVSAWLQDETSARETYGDISVWDTCEVTDMSDLFCAHADCGDKKKSAAASFNGNLSAWNVGKVSTMFRMFQSAKTFNSDVSKWDVSKVSTISYMFQSAKTFNGDVSKWDVSKVSTMQGTFDNAHRFNSDVSKWDVSKVSTMSYMFRIAHLFNSDVTEWDVSTVSAMTYMFYHAFQFNGDVSKWDVSKVSTMSHSKYSRLPFPALYEPTNPDTHAFALFTAFDNAHRFNSDVSKWDVSKVSTMSYMFQGAKTFNSDVSKWDVSTVSTMSH
eukprot:g5367.t1